MSAIAAAAAVPSSSPLQLLRSPARSFVRPSRPVPSAFPVVRLPRGVMVRSPSIVPPRRGVCGFLLPRRVRVVIVPSSRTHRESRSGALPFERARVRMFAITTVRPSVCRLRFVRPVRPLRFARRPPSAAVRLPCCRLFSLPSAFPQVSSYRVSIDPLCSAPCVGVVGMREKRE